MQGVLLGGLKQPCRARGAPVRCRAAEHGVQSSGMEVTHPAPRGCSGPVCVEEAEGILGADVTRSSDVQR